MNQDIGYEYFVIFAPNDVYFIKFTVLCYVKFRDVICLQWCRTSSLLQKAQLMVKHYLLLKESCMKLSWHFLRYPKHLFYNNSNLCSFNLPFCFEAFSMAQNNLDVNSLWLVVSWYAITERWNVTKQKCSGVVILSKHNTFTGVVGRNKNKTSLFLLWKPFHLRPNLREHLLTLPKTFAGL